MYKTRNNEGYILKQCSSNDSFVGSSALRKGRHNSLLTKAVGRGQPRPTRVYPYYDAMFVQQGVPIGTSMLEEPLC
jgi:hypothetical protein